MSLVVNTNISSLIVNDNLQKSAGGLRESMQRLSSGLKINNAGDDAAGLGLSEKIKSQITASDIANNNTQTGVNLLQVMDSDIAKIGEMAQRMRDLAVQSANGVYSAAERTALDTENTQLKYEMSRIVNSSNFSGANLLDGSLNCTLQVGTNSTANDRIAVTGYNYTIAANLNSITTNTLTTQALAQTALTNCDGAIDLIAKNRAAIGATINRLQGTMDRTASRKVNLESAKSVITDADIASESAKLTRNQILQQAAAAMLSQANQMPSLALKLIG